MGETEVACPACARGAFEGSPLIRVFAATLYLSPDSRFKWPHTREIAAMKATGAHAGAYADVLVRLMGRIDVERIVPVPSRQRAARALADAIAERLALPVEDALAFRRAVASQKRLQREARFANVRDALAATRRLDGARILLVDDVAASCATLMEAARAAHDAGATACIAAVAARESNTFALQRAGVIIPG